MSRSLSAEVLASRYRLDHQIASGGMGSVWRAVDLVLDRPVAVKLLRAEFAQHPETIARFRAEARHAAGLAHLSIAQVYDFGEAGADEPAFLVLELVDGPPLTDLIRTGPLPPDQVMDIVAQVASGLAVAHAAGVVHRDIKPGNLLLDSNGIVKITDFGVSYAAGSAPLTRTGTLLGTPAYLAPERVAGQAVGPASDLYSLGMVAYECLSGALPFTGTAMEVALAHRTQRLPPLPASVPAEVAGLVAELTTKDPGGRPSAVADVAARARALRDDAHARGLGSPDVTAELPVAAALPPTEPGRYGPVPPAGGYGAPSWQPWQRGRPRAGRRRFAVLAAAFAIAAGLAGWLIASLASTPATPHAQPPRSHASTHTTRTVTVNAAALVGRPIRLVVRDLRDRGLRVAVSWRPARDARPGTVLAVQPAGNVLPGTTVQVTAASREHHPGRGHGHDHGHGGNGQGDD